MKNEHAEILSEMGDHFERTNHPRSAKGVRDAAAEIERLQQKVEKGERFRQWIVNRWQRTKVAYLSGGHYLYVYLAKEEAEKKCEKETDDWNRDDDLKHGVKPQQSCNT